MWEACNHEYHYWETLHVCNDGSPNYNINSQCWEVCNHEYRYWETLHVCNDGSPNYNINSQCWTWKCVRMRSADPVSPNLAQSLRASPSLTQSHPVSPSFTQSHPVPPSLTQSHPSASQMCKWSTRFWKLTILWVCGFHWIRNRQSTYHQPYSFTS